MKTKQQAIQEKYGRFYDPKVRHYSVNGWTNPKAYTEEEMYEMMQEIDMEFGEHRCRPKSLQGIDNNNGWVKIESEYDLPKELIKCHFIIKGHEDKHYIGHYYDDLFWNNCNDAYSWPAVSHYQPIEKPKPPIY